MANACEDVLVVHIGAGFHSPKLTTAYRKLLKSSLTQDLIKSTSCVIEKSLLTNTGKGSNVDREGHASLDATYLQIKGKNVVKALSLINICDENPTNQILEANEWLDMEFSGGSLSSQFGLLRPTSLHHSTLQAKRRHLLVNDVTHSETESASEHHSGEIDDDGGPHSDLIPCTIEDTVGIAEIKEEVITAVTSSGGNFFKIPGRVSCAGIMGAGIAYSCKDQIQVITICTGNGDDITRMGLAGFLSEQIATQVSITSDQYFLSSVDSQGNPRIYLGAIVLLITPEYQRLLFCHSTESFYFGFKLKNGIEIVMSRKDAKTDDFLHGEYRL
ncbi:N-terminal nucleophile aminohydrolase [Metschnikowia bicuspidata]|uniref:N-terminal nucleophile aminohydrolase n=1 Tax=Metschnikowia bicuspidata TaxID=27322 RepID=A0A4P9Z9C4_9ASCO|nr:N-terminal nucleophile aminohydrolase [Metschnikowia bicuspidata]RKP29364.1 N-terminal nucleophile aminohydrolase [Metschnikowia bicuspidata]